MTQILQPETIQQLAGHFQRRYEANFAWENAVGLHLMLSQLRGFWPFSIVDENGDMYDLSAQGRVMTNNGTTPFGVTGLAPYADFTPGSSQYFSRLDETGLDITGALTLGGWFRLDTIAPGNNMGLMSKWTEAGNLRAYNLYFNDAGNVPSFSVSVDGAAVVTVNHTTALSITTWYHIVGRYTPSTAIDVFLNGVKVSNAVATPASLFNSTAAFEIGAYNAAAMLLDGHVTLGFLCAASLSDTVIWSIHQQTRAMFGG